MRFQLVLWWTVIHPIRELKHSRSRLLLQQDYLPDYLDPASSAACSPGPRSRPGTHKRGDTEAFRGCSSNAILERVT